VRRPLYAGVVSARHISRSRAVVSVPADAQAQAFGIGGSAPLESTAFSLSMGSRDKHR